MQSVIHRAVVSAMDSGVFIIDDVAAESLSYLEQVTPGDLTQSIESLRQHADDLSEKFRGDLVFSGSSVDIDIPCGGADGDPAVYTVPATILKPSNSEADKTWNNIIVYFHGGGWVWGSRKSHMQFCEAIAM